MIELDFTQLGETWLMGFFFFQARWGKLVLN